MSHYFASLMICLLFQQKHLIQSCLLFQISDDLEQFRARALWWCSNGDGTHAHITVPPVPRRHPPHRRRRAADPRGYQWPPPPPIALHLLLWQDHQGRVLVLVQVGEISGGTVDASPHVHTDFRFGITDFFRNIDMCPSRIVDYLSMSART